LLICYLWLFLFIFYFMFLIWVKENNFYLCCYLWKNWKDVMMVADIDKNMKWPILNLFLIACFNLKSIIFFLVENATKSVYQSSFSSQKWSNCNGSIIRLMLEQVWDNSYYYFTYMKTTKLLDIECELHLHPFIRF
jgi:hypothetical protein